jgi:hypothetical protein
MDSKQLYLKFEKIDYSTPKMGIASSFETLVRVYHTTLGNIEEGNSVDIHRLEYLLSNMWCHKV